MKLNDLFNYLLYKIYSIGPSIEFLIYLKQLFKFILKFGSIFNGEYWVYVWSLIEFALLEWAAFHRGTGLRTDCLALAERC